MSDYVSRRRGYLYIVHGSAFNKEAMMSIRALRRFTKYPIAVFTDDKGLARSDFDADILVHIQAGHLRAKVDHIHKSPFRETVYLDSDTLAVRNCDDMFDLLRRFDICATIDYARKRNKYATSVPEYGSIPYTFSEVNGGVLAFRRSLRTTLMFRLWRHYFYKYFEVTSGWDQVSLRIALWRSRVHLCHMPFEYNVRSKANREKQRNMKHDFGVDHMEPRLYHLHHSSAVHAGTFEVASLDEWEMSVKRQAVDF